MCTELWSARGRGRPSPAPQQGSEAARPDGTSGQTPRAAACTAAARTPAARRALPPAVKAVSAAREVWLEAAPLALPVSQLGAPLTRRRPSPIAATWALASVGSPPRLPVSTWRTLMQSIAAARPRAAATHLRVAAGQKISQSLQEGGLRDARTASALPRTAAPVRHSRGDPAAAAAAVVGRQSTPRGVQGH